MAEAVKHGGRPPKPTERPGGPPPRPDHPGFDPLAAQPPEPVRPVEAYCPNGHGGALGHPDDIAKLSCKKCGSTLVVGPSPAIPWKPLTPQPTVGRIVHYWAKFATEPWAAIIAAVDPDTGCTLHVFSPGAAFIAHGVHHSDRPQGSGTHVWSWPHG